MTNEARNDIFIQHTNLIRYSIRKNLPLIKALRLNTEDVYQDLSIRALKAIEVYDPARGMKLSNYIINMLQYEILHMRKMHSCDCRAANIQTVSLDSFYDNEEEEKPFDIPVFVDYDTDMITQEALSLLSDNEMDVFNQRMAGIGLTDKRQRLYMNRVQRKLAKYYGRRTAM